MGKRGLKVAVAKGKVCNKMCQARENWYAAQAPGNARSLIMIAIG